MINYCANNALASFERDKFFTPYIYTQGKRYYYEHWKLDKCTADGYITVTVFLEEKRNASELPDFNSPEAFFCEPD